MEQGQMANASAMLCEWDLLAMLDCSACWQCMRCNVQVLCGYSVRLEHVQGVVASAAVVEASFVLAPASSKCLC
jgi:hypothetical protein